MGGRRFLRPPNGRALYVAACALALVACSKDVQHPAFASGTCRTGPCGTPPVYHGTGSPPPDAAVDAGADASDSG